MIFERLAYQLEAKRRSALEEIDEDASECRASHRKLIANIKHLYPKKLDVISA